MQFHHFPAGEVSSRDLKTTFYFQDERYPTYTQWRAGRQPPFTVEVERGIFTKNLLFTADGKTVRFYPPVYELYRRFWAHQRLARLKRHRPKIESMEGTVVALDCTESEWCYGHWMMEVLPCFAVIEKANLGPHRLYIDLGEIRDFKAEQLERLGYTSADIIDPREHPCIRADRLVFVSQTRYSRWAKDFVVSKFNDFAEPETHGRLLYVTRSNTGRRVIINELEVQDVLTRYGFKTVDTMGMTFRDQVKLFKETSHVVCQMGSAVYNTWFCPPEAKILMLRAQNEYKYTEVLSDRNVYLLLCDRYDCSNGWFNIVVDVDDLDKAVKELVAV